MRALHAFSNSSKGYRREGQLTFAPRKPDILTPSRESFSSCCDSVAALALFFDSVAALALASCNERVAEAFFFATAPANTSRALHGAHPKFKAREVGETT